MLDIGNISMVRRYKGKDLSEEEYLNLKRQQIIDSAVNKAVTRKIGAAPTIERDGYTGATCLYTVTDNFGNKYRVGGTQTFVENPEKFGFTINGPIEQSKKGDIYIFIDKNKTPFHSSLITDYKDSKPLISYSEGNAQREIDAGQPIFTNSENGVYSDYNVNKPIWESPYYETYRFIGTPNDNIKWKQEYENLPQSIESLPSVKPILAKAMQDGGNIVEQAVKDSSKRREMEDLIDKLKNAARALPKAIYPQVRLELMNKLISNVDLSKIDFSKMDSRPRTRTIGYFTPFNPYERTKIIENGGKA